MSERPSMQQQQLKPNKGTKRMNTTAHFTHIPPHATEQMI